MMPNLRFASTLVIAAFAAACSDAATEPASPFQPSTVEQNTTGSNASAAGFAFFVDTKLADAPATNPLLRPTITTTAKLRNVRSEPALVHYGACNVSLAAYRTADRSGTPVWRSGASRPWEGTSSYGCILPLYERRLQPNEELSLGAYSTPEIEVIGDSLPNGRYHFTATVMVSVAPNGISLPAGDFDLTLERPPLPDSVTHDYIAYRGATNVNGATVRASVTGTLTHAGGVVVEYPRECEIELVAYRAKDRRDAAPRSGAPDWRGTRACAPGWRQTILNRGQSVLFESSASAAEILGSALPSGVYYFAVVVHTRSRNVWLSAGEAELRR